jgi:CHAT domain-containing protein
LPRLPFAEAEVQSIGELFPAANRTIWTGAHAREDSFTTASGSASYRFLHFATHGVVDSLVPERSHLLLAAGGEADSAGTATRGAGGDGFLQVSEIEQLHLDADIAVLSACDTGLGSVVRGEGVLGLARAFLFAGARAVAVSLWSVQDRSTATFMARFYRDLVVDRDRLGKAFAAAKTQMRESKEFAHPMFWSPFILVGSGNLSLAAGGDALAKDR